MESRFILQLCGVPLLRGSGRVREKDNRQSYCQQVQLNLAGQNLEPAANPP